MPPQNSSMSSFTVMPAGARCTPGFFTRPETENERRPLRPLRPWEANQSAPFSSRSRTQCRVSMLCSSVGRPKRPTWATYGGRRRGMPRLPSIASIIADSSPEMYPPAARVAGRQLPGGIVAQGGKLALEQLAARVVFVAQVDVDVLDADRPCGDEHPFDEAMRVALEVVAVLERAGLALVDVHRHEPWSRLGAHDAPLAPRGEAGAAQAAQARVFHGLDDGLDVALAADAVEPRLVTAFLAILRVAHRRLGRGLHRLRLHRAGDIFQRGVAEGVLADAHRGGFGAAADAGSGDDTHVRAHETRELVEQLLGPCHLA